MPVINRIADFHDDMTAWRRDLHAHPETAFEEKRTSDIVAAKLEEFGITVHRGLAQTGVVGTLSTGEGPSIGLRADLDALDVEELNDFDHKSTHDGKMHACGHDGHTTMLLGAAKYLSETRNFKGTVQFIFQPAEENEGGGRVMVEEGLFEKFPVDAVYGMHNWPGQEAGFFAVTEGPLMAAFDIFEMTITGRGAHGGMPHTGIDPIPVAAEIISALQTIVSRATDPQDSAVVTVTQIHAGHAWNVIPDDVILRGTTRSFRPEVQDTIEPAIRRIAEGICQAHSCQMEMMYERRYPPTINEAVAT
ncbi:MAG: amidohydrolase, partial [Rhodospirillaceae bacterium]|nr:amidohydrolase [Rhodospirillaceae bacterium]